mgnify:CR=1 FL=1
MRPRWLDRGEKGDYSDAALIRRASMRPRWLDRGEVVASFFRNRCVTRFNEAAVVGPRRGCTDLNARELRHLASMRPRWLDRGERCLGPLIQQPWLGFNEAAVVGPRRAEPTRAGRAPPSMLQ